MAPLSAAAPPPLPPAPPLPWPVRVAMVGRLLAVQAAWNYESMVGTGLAFAAEPAFRLLPGGRGGDAYRAALARHSGYFNAHPYLAGAAAGAVARAELSGDDPARIDRLRGACCGPLGSVGDQLVWAGWLPLCSLLALFVFGLGAGPLVVVLTFLLSYNVGHLALRWWAVGAGWRGGLQLASVLATPLLRQGPVLLARAIAGLAGVAVPLAVARVVGARPTALAAALGVALCWTIGSALLSRRLDGWRAALAAVAAYVLLSCLP
jgi:mannose PTS system EIID component